MIKLLDFLNLGITPNLSRNKNRRSIEELFLYAICAWFKAYMVEEKLRVEDEQRIENEQRVENAGIDTCSISRSMQLIG